MSDTPPRKKLSLNPVVKPTAGRSAATRPTSDDDRQRSGPRARVVQQASIESNKARRSASTETAPASGDERASAPRRPRPDEGSAPRAARRPDDRTSAAPRGPRKPDSGAPRRSAPRTDPASGVPSGYDDEITAVHRAERGADDRGARAPRNAGENNASRGPRIGSGERSGSSNTPAHYQRNRPSASRVAAAEAAAAFAAAGPGASFNPRAAADAAAAARKSGGPEVFPVFAPCPQGLEGVLVEELISLGFADAWAGRAGAHFIADWTAVMRVNMQSRLATRILVQVSHGIVYTEDDLLELARATPWERWFGAEQTLRVDTSAVRSPMKSLQFCNLRAKDGICDRLRDLEGERPSIDTVRPDARVHVFLTETTATLYLDTSGESLFKRGWRLDKGEAPLRENLAAGMLALSGWKIDSPLLDPFCGSGTIVIEAALKALNVPPGITRPFAFERLRGHQEWRWRDLKEDARAHILRELPMQLAGADIDERAIAAARDNAQRAGLTEDAVYFEVADARDTCPLDDKPGWIITNPPYGERLDTTEDPALWSEWASTLKREFNGWQMHMITNDMDLPKKLRLNPSKRTPLYNGALECRLFGFDLVSGGFRR